MRLIGAGSDIRLPSFRGRFVVARVNGGIQIRGATRKAPRKRTPKQIEAQDRFSEAVAAMKYISALDRITAAYLSNRLSLLPRDWLMMCLFGRVARFSIAGYGRLQPMSSRKDASLINDGITTTPGSLMYRGSDLWMPVPPGNAGDVLRFRADDKVPYWSPMPTEGQWRAMMGCPAASTYSGARCFCGTVFRPPRNMDVYAVWQLINMPAGTRKYKPVVGYVTPSGSFPVAGITVGPEVTITRTIAGAYWERAAFTFPAAMTPQALSFAGLMRTDGTGTTSQDSRFTTATGEQLPFVSVTNDNAVSFNTLTPVVGTVPTFVSGNFPIGLEFS